MPNSSSSPIARSGFVPLMVHESHASAPIDAYFNAVPPRAASRDKEAFDRTIGDRRDDAPYGSYRIANGVALIPVMGALIPRGLFLGSGYATSYEAFGAECRRVAEDPDVEDDVFLLIDSPGGYVTGIDAAANAIATLRQTKKVTAYVNGMCCSAAYWLAAACDEIVCSPLSELGSIGIVQVHFDMSKMLDAIGIAVTVMHAGAKKGDGNPYEPLSDRVKADMDRELEDLRMAFATAVASGRASLDIAAVLATEAATYRGDDAVKRGLADRVGFVAEDLPDSDDPLVTSPYGRFMEKNMITQAQLDAAVADAKKAGAEEGRIAGHAAGVAEGKTAGHSAGKAEGLKEGAVAERERIKGIGASDEAKKRPQAANQVALQTDMPVEAAKGFLAGLPEEATKSAASLDAEMDKDRQPILGADGQPIDKMTGEQAKFAEGKATAERLLGKK